MGGRIFHQTHWAPLLQMQGSVVGGEARARCTATGTPMPMVLNARPPRPRAAAIVHELAAFVAADRDKYERELLAARKRAEELLRSTRRTRAARPSAAATAAAVRRADDRHRQPRPAQPAVGDPAGRRRCSARGELSRPQQQRARADHRARPSARSRLIADLLDFTQARLGQRPVGRRCESIDLHAGRRRAPSRSCALAFPGRELEHRTIGERRLPRRRRPADAADRQPGGQRHDLRRVRRGR